MKNILTLTLLLFLSIRLASAQDYVYQEYIPESSDFKELRAQLRKDDLAEIIDAFLQNDFEKLEPYLLKKLVPGTKEIIGKIRSAAQKQPWLARSHYNTSSFGLHPFAPFAKKNNLRMSSSNPKQLADYEVTYTYIVVDSMICINSIFFVLYSGIWLRAELPKELEAYDKIANDLRDIDDLAMFEKKITELKRIEERLIPYRFPFTENTVFVRNLSISYGNLAWHLIFKNKYKDAITAANKGLKTDSTQRWIYTNLALGYLLNNDYEKAKALYIQLKDQPISKTKNFNEAFLKDLDEAKEAGLANGHFAKIYAILHGK